ncbi:hypothetical protein GQ53DRAFT_191197 [Thozetella sp. PMI_491]|nr:hypothetical protein GQ53DRAFT_191197 [Thozetella sp. PMI_491]
MAGPEENPQASAIALDSYDTALCIIPPREAWPTVDRLRELYDKAYEKWPPHVNLVYPFIRPELLRQAAASIESVVSRTGPEETGKFRVSLDSADVFSHKHSNTIYVHDSNRERCSRLSSLRTEILEDLGHKEGDYQMHMTIGQSEDASSSSHKFLLNKVSLLPPIEWDVDRLYILVRERLQVDSTMTSEMKIWGTVDLATAQLSALDIPSSLYERRKTAVADSDTGEKDQLQTRPTYYYEAETEMWLPYAPEPSETADLPKTLVVSSYNVLAEFEWPPSRSRYPLLLKNILSRRAAADILVLQEVTDDFLSHLLRDEQIHEAYDFVSHGPPDQSDVEPLPSLLNIVVLSRFPFEWEWVPFSRKHKGSVVAKFSEIGKWEDGQFFPLVVAGVHLSHGLTDGAVTAKKGEIQRILNYLSAQYPRNPWILAGDTNISTSSYSIDTALNKKAISSQTANYLSTIDNFFAERKLVDAWAFARFDLGEPSDGEYDEMFRKEVFEGEQGATYDPSSNEVAAEVVGSGFNMRPQRYDRIMVKGEGVLAITRFNMLGFLKETVEGGLGPTYASDHWGVRCTMRVGEEKGVKPSLGEISSLVVPVHLKKATGGFENANELRDVLSRLHVFPSQEDVKTRQEAFALLQSLVEDAVRNPLEGSGQQRRPALVVVPVGSYGLGVWTPSSDVDCLCIGPFGTHTFFAVVTQRLRRAEGDGVRIMRRVKANTGTMLELEVRGVKMDLQYCPATSIAEHWPEVLRTRPADPIWTLSTQTLLKLKAIRDLDYLRRSVPDLVKFRLAHRTIKTWAKSRGLYSARFGYLGGIHISILLARVCKLLARDGRSDPASVPDILATFFHHYASFDWKNEAAFDPFFHKTRLQYTRTTREPLAILGYFPPSLNTSHAASLPSVRTIAEEFKQADALLSSPGAAWSALLGGSGAVDFLSAYKSYIKIDAQFWGLSSMKGAGFIGWLESRCVLLLVDVNRRTPGIHARIWPARFVAAEEDGEEPDTSRDYQGHYLVGLDKLDPTMGRDELKLAFGSLQTVLRRFEELIRGDEKYFDAKNCWMSASVVSQAELGELQVDRREWGGYTPGEDESDEEEEEDAVADDDGAERQDYVPLSKKDRKHGAADIVVPRLEPGKKFRTAADVMNRLRWDPELDSSDYIVGYLDRFVGPMERALDTWKLEQTDEEFIPQHRILSFKQRSTGKIVWERRTRKDEIFGSGVE